MNIQQLREIIHQESPTKIEIGTVVGADPRGVRTTSVRLSGGRVCARAHSCVDGLEVGNKVMVVRSKDVDRVVVIGKVLNEYESSLARLGALEPPDNLSAVGSIGTVILTWDAYPPEDLCWEVRYNTTQDEDTATSALVTRGSYYVHRAVTSSSDTGESETFYFQVRAIRWISDNNVMYSGWSGWVTADSIEWLKEHDHSGSLEGGTSLRGISLFATDSPVSVTLDSGQLTPSGTYHEVSSESGATDDMDRIAYSGVDVGRMIVARPALGNTITVKHNAVGGNIHTRSENDIVLSSPHDHIIAIYMGDPSGVDEWAVIAGGAVTGGGGSSNFIGLDDTPTDYTDDGGKLVRVNMGEDALEFVASALGDVVTGDLCDLDDVTSDTPSDGDVLTWDQTEGQWEPQAPTTTFEDEIVLKALAADPSGTAGHGKVYTKDDGNGNIELYYVDESGNTSKLTEPWSLDSIAVYDSSEGVINLYADPDDAFTALETGDILIVPPGEWTLSSTHEVPAGATVCGLGGYMACMLVSKSEIGGSGTYGALLEGNASTIFSNLYLEYWADSSSDRSALDNYGGEVYYCYCYCKNSGSGDAYGIHSRSGEVEHSHGFGYGTGSGDAYGIYMYDDDIFQSVGEAALSQAYGTGKAYGIYVSCDYSMSMHSSIGRASIYQTSSCTACGIYILAGSGADLRITNCEGSYAGYYDYGDCYGLYMQNSSGVPEVSGGLFDAPDADIYVETGAEIGIYGAKYSTTGGGGTITHAGGDRAGIDRDETITGNWEFDGATTFDGTTQFNNHATFAEGKTINLEGVAGPASGAQRSILRLMHMLDGGLPTNPYPSTRNSDDAEFNNSSQALNDTIGSHASGDFWEWKDDASYDPPTATYETADIHSTRNSMLYVRKAHTASNPSVLVGDISSISETEVYMCEVVLMPVMWNKTGSYFAIRLYDSSSGYYIRLKLSDDTTNGLQLIATYYDGSAHTMATVTFGQPIGPIVMALRRYASSGNAYGRWYYHMGGSGYYSHFTGSSRIALVSICAQANFVPNQAWLEFDKTVYMEFFVDSYRRT